MQFLKKHYEKLILSLVLLGLAATALWFYRAVESARSHNVDLPQASAPKPWTNYDLTKEVTALKAFNSPPALDLISGHRLFNPVTWKLMPEGATNFYLKKITEEGPAALKVTDISAVYYTIAFDRQAGDAYHLVVTPGVGRANSAYYHLNEKGDKTKPVIITGTNAAADGTTTLTLSFIDSGEVTNITMKTAYRRIDSYTADLQYPPENSTFTKQHTNQIITLSGEPYKIVAITHNTVTIEDNKTAQRTPIEWSGAH
jgi:hypothetical protein